MDSKAYGLRGPNLPSYRITNLAKNILLVTTCGIIKQLQGDQWPTQNEAVNVEMIHTIGLDREIYTQPKKDNVRRNQMNG